MQSRIYIRYFCAAIWFLCRFPLSTDDLVYPFFFHSGAHSIGVIHCKFFQNRLYNFSGTNEPDPSLDIEFLNELRSRCSNTDALSTSASGYTSHDTEQPLSDFGMLYYRGLLQGKGIIYADQQLMEGEKAKYWVQEYASNPTLFHQDFALAMMKLSDLRVLTLPMGQIRVKCSKVAWQCC